MPHLFGHFRARVGTLPLPKWGNAVVQFAQLPPWKYPRCGRTCSVSDASVIRARTRANQARADRAAPRPAAVKPGPVWTKPAEKPVAFEDLFLWVLYDAELADLERLDKGEIPKELHRVRSIPERQRIYTAEERYIIAVGQAGQFSEDKHDDLSFPGAETREERHQYDLWPFFTETVGENNSGYDLKVRQLTLQEVASALPVMTTLANLILRAANKDVRKLIDAKTASAQTYQVSELILRLYRFGMRDRVVPDEMLRAARAVYQTISIDLLLRDYENRIARGEKGRSTHAADLLEVVRFMLTPGKSSYDAAIKFDRDASSLRERLNDSLDIIEAKYGSFCKDLGLPPQTGVRAEYNGNRIEDWAADCILDHDDEAARYRRAEAAAYLIDEKWLRDAYRALAEHFERGGHIFYGPTGPGVAPPLFDGRSNAQVLKDAGVVERDERRFPPPKAKRPRPNTEYGIDVGLRHSLADAVPGTDDDDMPIRDTRETSSAVRMREVSPFLPNIITLSPYDEE